MATGAFSLSLRPFNRKAREGNSQGKEEPINSPCPLCLSTQRPLQFETLLIRYSSVTQPSDADFTVLI
jgi:hypothetical protein